MTVRLVPIDLVSARRYVAEHHRHNIPPQGHKFSVGVEQDGQLVGVGVAGRPTGRGFDDGQTIEITRTCTDGTPNVCSMLYGALTRAAFALGYQRVITYTLQSEPGASLRASGFIVDAELDEREAWIRNDSGRYQTDLFGEERRPAGPKLRWVRQR